MPRSFVTLIALCSLLTHAAIGVGSGAVLCIKGSDAGCGAAPVTTACTCNCVEEAPPARTLIQLCTPCHDECNDCVEVDLPDESTPAVVTQVQVPTAALLTMAWEVPDVISEPTPALPVIGWNTGPPDRAPLPGALIVESTILLL